MKALQISNFKSKLQICLNLISNISYNYISNFKLVIIIGKIISKILLMILTFCMQRVKICLPDIKYKIIEKKLEKNLQERVGTKLINAGGLKCAR